MRWVLQLNHLKGDVKKFCVSEVPHQNVCLVMCNAGGRWWEAACLAPAGEWCVEATLAVRRSVGDWPQHVTVTAACPVHVDAFFFSVPTSTSNLSTKLHQTRNTRSNRSCAVGATCRIRSNDRWLAAGSSNQLPTGLISQLPTIDQSQCSTVVRATSQSYEDTQIWGCHSSKTPKPIDIKFEVGD